MACFHPVADLTLVLEYHDLVGATLCCHLRDDMSAIDGWLADLDSVVTGQE